MSRSILLITQYFPPSEMVAARRPAGFAKYLERQGHDVTVLTSKAFTVGSDGEIPGVEVVRTGDLMDSPLNWRRKQFRAWTGKAPASDYTASVSWPARVIVPDVTLLTWMPYVLAATRRLLRERRFDCVFTTSGPESVHFAGLAAQRSGAAWIADLRDGWGFESLHDWPTRAQFAIDHRLERLVARRADGFCAVTEPIAADLRERFGADAWTIPNGYDPDEAAAANDHGLLRSGAHTLLHTGRMASSQRSPATVLEALRLLGERAPAVAERIELALAGPLTPEERELLAEPRVADRVTLLGSLPREQVLELQRAADSLLLLTAGNRRGEATGKLYEYLAAGRPVLVLGDDTEAARIVRDAGAGIAVPADDAAAVAGALERLVSGEVTPAGPPPAYAYPALAERLAELVEVAIGRAAQRNSRA